MPRRAGLALSALLALSGCSSHLALLAMRAPRVEVAAPLPLEIEYREAAGGLVLLQGRVNDRADLWFILDTGAPVGVLIDGRRTQALGLDTRAAEPLGDPDDPASPVGIVQGGFRWAFGPVSLNELTAVIVPEERMPCRERFDALDFAGVVGADLFRRFVVEIDPRARRIRLHDPPSWQAPPGAVSVPLTFRRGHVFIPARVTLSSGEEIERELQFDIGSNSAVNLVAGSHPALPMPEGASRYSCLVSGKQELRVGAPLTLTVGGVVLPVDKPVFTDGRVKLQRMGSVGLALFGGRPVAIDYPGQRLVILAR